MKSKLRQKVDQLIKFFKTYLIKIQLSLKSSKIQKNILRGIYNNIVNHLPRIWRKNIEDPPCIFSPCVPKRSYL